MDKNSHGSYSENRNGAVADKVEPGSTFKVASLMAVLDEGKAHLSDVIETGKRALSLRRINYERPQRARADMAPSRSKQAINASSNVGISRTVVNAFGSDPGRIR